MTNKELLQACSIALDDWLYQYAADQCNPKKVRESVDRIFREGGTLAYIADLQQELRAHLKGKP